VAIDDEKVQKKNIDETDYRNCKCKWGFEKESWCGRRDTFVTAFLHQDIADELARFEKFQKIAERVKKCRQATCDRCGDICPIRAARTFESFSDRLNRLFDQDAGFEVREFVIRRSTWCRPKGELSDTSLGSIFKTLRRALDSLERPSLIAVGAVDACWNVDQWQVGAKVIAASPTDVDLYRAFDHTRDIEGPFRITKVSDPREAVSRLFIEAQLPKCATTAGCGELPKRSVRGDYYAWLAGLAPGSRIFRYGCDRYFNLLTKEARPVRHKIKKGHPDPTPWLRPWQYHRHDDGCRCWMCRNPNG
jgi:hypothetical protein